MQASYAATSMFLTDVGDEICWSELWYVDDNWFHQVMVVCINTSVTTINQ